MSFLKVVDTSFLKLLKSLSPFCLISEVNWNHDIPDKYSPELIYSVSINMHYIFSDIIESDITEIAHRNKAGIDEGRHVRVQFDFG